MRLRHHAVMELVTSIDPGTVAGLARRASDADPVRNSIFGAIEAQARTAESGCWCASHGPAVAARGARTTPVAMTAGWPALAPLAAAIGALPELAGIGGPVATVDELVRIIGREPATRMAERLFRLDELSAPAGVAGAARRGGVPDIDLLTAWYTDYVREAFAALPPGFGGRAGVARGVERGGVWMWETPDGAPVAMAVRHLVQHGVARLGPVYTPPELRGRGYGSAVTAAATRDVLADSATPVLYTDLANPTSNRIYQVLGYRPVEDRAAVTFR